MNQIEVAHEMI